MGSKTIVAGSAAVVIVLIVGAVILLQGQTSAPASSPSPSGSVAKVKCPVTPGQNATELKTTDTKVGTGAEATAASRVSVRYTGCLADGTVFDSTKLHGDAPATFGLDQVIQGWKDGIPGMKVGGVRTLVIPPSQGYGAQGAQTIPGNATLTFQVELVGVQ